MPKVKRKKTNKVLANLYAGPLPRGKRHAAELLRLKVTHIVNLTELDESNNQCVRRVLRKNPKCKLLHYPLADMTDGNLATVYDAVTGILRIISGVSNVVYVHCYGGNGRTGMICAIVAAIWNCIDADQAMRLVQQGNSQRSIYWRGVSPETMEQRRRVRDIVRSVQA